MYNEDVEFIDFLDNHSPDNTGCRLYHYTTSSGFLGIFNHFPDGPAELWASEIRYMNDASEFFHGIKIIQEQAKKLFNDESNEMKRGILKNICERIHTLEGPIFITSFCEEDDLLSQWRGYSGETGYSIGWDFNQLKTASQPNDWVLARCIYDSEAQSKATMHYIRYHLNHWFDVRIKNEPYLEPYSEFYFGVALRRFIPLLKHSSFSEEKEWRLISAWPVRAEKNVLEELLKVDDLASALKSLMKNQDIHYRPGRSGIIPYVNFKLESKNKFSPVSIRIGPNSLVGMSVQALKLFIASKNISEECKIMVSGSPFRA